MLEISTGKTTRIIGMAIAGLLLLLPLPFLQHSLTVLAERDETHLEVLAREKLMYEMEKFQDALRPDVYIEKALSHLNSHFGLKGGEESQRQLTFTQGIDPKLIDATFIDKARQFLSRHYQIKPFLMLASDCDLRNHWLWTAIQLFPDAATRATFAEAAVYGLACVDDDPVNFLTDGKNLTERIEAFIDRNREINESPHQIFAKYFVENISPFSNPMLYQAQARIFFSNRFGNQRSYQIFHLLNAGFPPQEKLLGLYYCCFNNCDMPPAALLKKAMAGRVSDASRHLLRKTVTQPFFQQQGDRFFYFADFPTVFHTLAEDYGLKNPDSSNKIRQFLGSHCMVTSIEAAQLRSAYRKPANLLGVIIRLLLLLLFAALVRFLPGPVVLPCKLGGKLRLAVALAVMLPVAGFLIIGLLIRNHDERLAIHNCQTRMRQHLQLFENMISENDPRLGIMFQGFKKHFADSLYASTDDDNGPVKMTEPYELLKFANISMFFSRKARMIKFFNQKAYDGNLREMGGLCRILSELDAIDPGNQVINELMRKQLLLNSFTDSYWDVFATGPLLAKESLPIRNFLSISALKRACNQLIARPQTPDKPEAILFHEIGDLPVMRSLLKQIWRQAPALLTDYSERHQIDYSLFLRGPSELRELQIPRTGPGVAPLRAIADKALQRRTSGSLINRPGDEIELQSWVYYEDIPVIITARAILPAIPLASPLSSALPMALLVYAVLAMALLSDALAEALLVPVQTLLAFVGSIKSNQLDVRAEIQSGDEFAELADSFNRMSNGLCQRAKMRRFVSEKLFESLAGGESALPSGRTMVTILSSDVRGFTTISEQYPPEEIVSLLNDYFTAMETAITANGGSIEKIVGDAIIAAFYPDKGDENHACRAGKAAMAMREALATFNSRRRQQKLCEIATGIGIASGEAVLGFAGSTSRRREFFLLGDAIQRAESLEAMTKNGISSRIFVDQATCKLMERHFSFCPPAPGNDSNFYYRELKHD